MLSIPDELLEHTGTVISVERPRQGDVFDTYVLACAHGRFVLKTGDNLSKVSELEDEFDVLSSLYEQRPFVAQPVARVVREGDGAFLFSYLDGVSMVDEISATDQAGRHRLIGELGRALRRIHRWDPALSRESDWLARAVRQASANVAAGRVPSPVAHAGQFRGASPQRLLDELHTWQGRVDEDIVFCHGDYCLPNVLVRSEKVVGVVDWSAGGYADRRFDLAAARWSIRHNLGSDEYVDTFLRAYGYTAPAATLDNFEALYALL